MRPGEMSQATFLSWRRYVNALGVAIIAELLYALALVYTSLPQLNPPDWTPYAVGALAAVAYALASRS